MEYHLLNNYIKYQKEHSVSLIKEIKSIPIYGLIFLSLAIIFGVIAAIFAFIDSTSLIFWISIILETITAFALFIYEERWNIKHSDKELYNFKNESKELYKWLCSLSISSRSHIETIVQRLIDDIDDDISRKEKANEKADRWMQTMIIPIALAIITSIIANRNDIDEILYYVVSIIAIVLMIYAFIWIVRSVKGMIQKQRRSKIEYFIEALKGVIDVIFIFNSEDEGCIDEESNIANEIEELTIERN